MGMSGKTELVIDINAKVMSIPLISLLLPQWDPWSIFFQYVYQQAEYANPKLLFLFVAQGYGQRARAKRSAVQSLAPTFLFQIDQSLLVHYKNTESLFHFI